MQNETFVQQKLFQTTEKIKRNHTPRNSHYSVVSLFSGCGGMDLGFRGGFSVFGREYSENPFEIIWANEINQAACRTYRRNLDGNIRCGDIWDYLKELPSSADVLIGGFPCQDLSINGKGLGIRGSRSGQYLAMVEAIKIVKPKIFVAENVKGLLLKTRRESFIKIMDDFRSLGYNVSHSLYHAADYGVPQSRERVFIVGTRGKIKKFNPPPPEVSSENWITALEAIGDLESKEKDESVNHIWSAANISGEQGNRRLKADRPGYTIRAECHGNIQFHYSLPRRISMREAARIQSFPDDFIFESKLRETERQVGNAVPPILAWYIANAVAESLASEFVYDQRKQFENLLDSVAAHLTKEAEENIFETSKSFENRVRQILEKLGSEFEIEVDYNPHPFVFPDIAVGEFGVEVKFTAKDTWRSVANSVFETFRDQAVIYVYVIFGKMGGVPEVKWARYDDCVIHVRTSHVPRFELEIGAESSLFDIMEISYEDFSVLPIEQKMRYIRDYARGRLKKGERLWWLEEKSEPDHTLPIQVRLYIDLPSEEKTRLRAEATLLCPRVVAGSRVRNKYNDVALYLLTYHGVLVSQARDLFSAGSVAHRKDKARGGIYIQRAIEAIEDEMLTASLRMEDALFVEYWGESVPPSERISKWLEKADELATDWVPSQTLFLGTKND